MRERACIQPRAVQAGRVDLAGTHQGPSQKSYLVHACMQARHDLQRVLHEYPVVRSSYVYRTYVQVRKPLRMLMNLNAQYTYTYLELSDLNLDTYGCTRILRCTS